MFCFNSHIYLFTIMLPYGKHNIQSDIFSNICLIMKNDVLSIKDPLGNQIFLPDELGRLHIEDNQGDIYDDVASVVKSPAMIIKISRGEGFELNYYRSVGWKMTLLIVAVFAENKWRAVECIQNPSSEKLTRMMAEGTIIQGIR